jgi:hypothetical protein
MRRSNLTALIAMFVLMVLTAIPARAQLTAVTLNFVTLTATHAAIGAPVKWQIAITNTGTTTNTVKWNVVLVAPDATSYTLLSANVKPAAGELKSTFKVLTTSTYTSQTGAFVLRGFTSDPNTGTVIYETDIPITISTVPANSVYGSIGGQGPAAALQGRVSDYSTVTANLGASAITTKTRVTMLLTDGSSHQLVTTALTSLNPGKNVITEYSVNSDQYSTADGNYAVRVDVLDASNNVLATDTYTFNRTGLAAYPIPVFADMSTTAGINVPRAVQPIANCNPFTDQMPGFAGAAVADYDGDGFEDIFVVDSTGNNHLWRNNGNGTFTDMAVVAGIPTGTAGIQSSGASFADINNDGFPDLLILYNSKPNVMLLNDGHGHFTDISATAGITNPVVQNNVTATWGDYDNDGFLDLYVTVHADCKRLNKNDHLYHNNENNTFTDMTSLLGGSSDARVNGRGLSPLFFDYNNDGRVDLYVGNDLGNQAFSHPNVLWRNDGAGGPLGWQFTDVSAATGAGVNPSDMGKGWSDYNRSGRFSIFITNVLSNLLLQEQSTSTYTSVAGNGPGGAQIARPNVPNADSAQDAKKAVTWGAAFYDFNNDTWEDLFAAGGNLDLSTNLIPSVLFMNNGDGTFSDFSLLSGTASAVMSMPTAVYADFDQDGFMDIYTQGVSGAPHLFMNQSRQRGNTNHWLEVKLVGGTSNRDAVGARLTASVGGVNLLRMVVNGGGYQGNSTLVQHFGLGAATQVDTLTVNWPSGKMSVLTAVSADQRMTLLEP